MDAADGNRLTPAKALLYSARRVVLSANRKDLRNRAMRMYHYRFAFTWRFPFEGRRAGETRADLM